MGQKRKLAGQASGMPGGILLGVGAAMIIILLCAMVLAWLVASERISEEMVSLGCCVIWPLASAAGNLVAWSAIREKRLIVMGITTTSIYVMLLISALAFGGQYQGIGTAALLVCLGGGISMIPELIGKGSGAKGHNNRSIVKLHKKFI